MRSTVHLSAPPSVRSSWWPAHCGGREGGGEGGGEGGREKEREGGREGGRERGREGGREGEREGGRKGGREGERGGGREGREGGRGGGRKKEREGGGREEGGEASKRVFLMRSTVHLSAPPSVRSSWWPAHCGEGGEEGERERKKG